MNGTNCPPAAGKLLVDGQDARTKQEILQMIVQYLHDEGYTAAVSLRASPAPSLRGLQFLRLSHASTAGPLAATPVPRHEHAHDASTTRPRHASLRRCC